MKWATALAIMAAALSLASESARAQLNDVTWVGDPNLVENWNDGSNWDLGFVPSKELGSERALINNGGTAFIDTFDPINGPVAGLVLGGGGAESGFVEIRSGGTLEVVPDDIVVDPNGGIAFIGGSGRGGVDVLPGGTFRAETLRVGGDAATSLSARGAAGSRAEISVTTNANLSRVTRIEGPHVGFDIEGNLTIGGTFIPVLTGADHSTITVNTGTASLGGTLRPEFGGGFTPSLGDSWTLVTADTVSGAFDAIDTSHVPALPRGVAFEVSVVPNNSADVVLSVANRLILNVNRSTGAATIENAVGDPIDIHGYSIGSPSGLLDSSDNAWQSLSDGAVDGWFEANPTASFLSELNPTSSTAIGAGVSLDLGSPYSFMPTELGQSGDDVTFEYSTVDGRVFNGIVEYSGSHNNLVLSVDPTTGEASLTNESAFSAEIIGYTVASLSGSLLPGDANWNSLEDQSVPGWREANPTPFFLNELNPTGSNIFDTGTSFNLGNLFDPAGSQDLTLEFALIGGEILDGIVVYEMAQQCSLVGDTTPCDDVVNIDDLNGVRNNFGTGDGSDITGIPGDTVPFDGFVNIDDLNGVRNNFGAMADPLAVPEPGTWLIWSLGSVILGIHRARRLPRLRQ